MLQRKHAGLHPLPNAVSICVYLLQIILYAYTREDKDGNIHIIATRARNKYSISESKRVARQYYRVAEFFSAQLGLAKRADPSSCPDKKIGRDAKVEPLAQAHAKHFHPMVW